MAHNIIQFPTYTAATGCTVSYKWELYDAANVLVWSQSATALNLALNNAGLALGLSGNTGSIDFGALAVGVAYTYNAIVNDSCINGGAAQLLIKGAEIKNVACCEPEPIEMVSDFCSNVKSCETLTTITNFALNGTVLSITYVGEDGVAVTKPANLAGLVTIDTDTRLNNPHFGAGAAVGFSRLFFDLVNVVSGTTITPNFSFIDIPITTINIGCGLVGTNTVADPIKLNSALFSSNDISTVTGPIVATDVKNPLVEAYTVLDGCKVRVFVGESFVPLEFANTNLAAITDLLFADFVEISLQGIPSNQNVNNWFAGLAGTKLGQQIAIHWQGAANGFSIDYARTTTTGATTHPMVYGITKPKEFYSFTVVQVGSGVGIKLN